MTPTERFAPDGDRATFPARRAAFAVARPAAISAVVLRTAVLALSAALLPGIVGAQSGAAAIGGAAATDGAAATGGAAATESTRTDGKRSQPVWEAGIGLSALTLPDYRGSGKSRGYLLPLPYLVYRSPHLSLDRGGLKAELLDRGRLELDFSVNLSVPVRSDGNPARTGMPGLRPSLEVGPQLLAELWKTNDGRGKLQLQLPLRYAFALSSSTRDVGFVFHPRLAFDLRDPAGQSGWNLGLIAGPLFATARNHDYFYTVDPQYATATRPAYRAGGGYGGLQFTAALSKRFPRHWFGAFLRIDQLNGAVFEDSPLVQKRTTVAAGVAFSWIFAESTERITRR